MFDNIKNFSEYYEFQIINSPRIRTESFKEEMISEENRKYSSIIKFDSVKDFKYEYNKVFKNLKKNPVPSYSEKHITYSDYGIIPKDEEKINKIKIETEDIFYRDRNNFVKEDPILSIMKKLNKN